MSQENVRTLAEGFKRRQRQQLLRQWLLRYDAVKRITGISG
jgi:hypothetical protein